MKTNLSAVKMSKRARKALDAQAAATGTAWFPSRASCRTKRPTTAAGRVARIGRNCCRSNKRCKKTAHTGKQCASTSEIPFFTKTLTETALKTRLALLNYQRLTEISAESGREGASRWKAREMSQNLFETLSLSPEVLQARGRDEL